MLTPRGSHCQHPQDGPALSRPILIKDLLEDVLEAPVVGLEDGVLSAQVERPLLLDGVLEAAVCKARDGLQGKHTNLVGPCPSAWHASRGGEALQGPPEPHSTSSVLYMPMPTPPPGKLNTSHSLAPLPSLGVKTSLNVPDLSTTKSVALYCGGQAVSAGAEGAAGQPHAAPAHLVAVGVAADGDGLGPAGHQARNVLADDGLPEHRPAQDVSDSAIGALPHLLQLELCGVCRWHP